MDKKENASAVKKSDKPIVEVGTPEQREEVLNYKNRTLTHKQFKHHPANPEKSLLITIYSRKSKQVRVSNTKRRDLVGKLVMYNDVDRVRRVGECIGFYVDGRIAILPKDDCQPHRIHAQLTFIFDV